MILGYKKYWPWGGFTNFAQKIILGKKIHTIRIDKNNRWKPGMKIQHAHGVRTKYYIQFFKGECISVQPIQIDVFDKFKQGCFPITFKNNVVKYYFVKVSYRILEPSEILQLSVNDGFDSVYSFFQWFKNGFQGKIIHFTDFKY